MHRSTAIIYIPPDHPNDAQFARMCIDHVGRRGYVLFTIVRNWLAVEMHLAVGSADVIVIATRTEGVDSVDRAEYVDEEQARILRRNNAAVGRHRVSVHLTEHGVRRVLCGDGIRPGGVEYDTAPILPRGTDGGFAERFLNERRGARDT